MIKTINDLDKLYDNGAITVDSDYDGKASYQCPVCHAQYKTKKGADTHINKRSCFDLQNLFKGTMTELQAYGIYKTLIQAIKPDANLDIRSFKKSPYYNGTVRFVIFTNINDMSDMKETYMTWLTEFKSCEKIQVLLSVAIKESTLREFRLFLQKFPQFIDSEKWYDRYEKDLKEDGHFFLRSLEKAKISLQWLLEKDEFPFEQVMESLDPEYQIRFEDLANRILTEVV